MIKCLSIHVYGLVQGVWFRKFAQKKAHELGLSGIVKNEVNGSVYIEVEGKVESLNIFLECCKIGPSKAKVSNIIDKEIPLKRYSGFIIMK